MLVSRREGGPGFGDLLTGDGMQEIYQIDYAVGVAEGRVDRFATAIAPDRDHPAMGTIYN